MKWSAAVHHLDELAHAYADMAERPITVFPLRVVQLWVYADVFAGHDDLDCLRVLLAVDVPVDDVAWLCPPQGAEHWSNATRLSQSPIVAMWRSTRAPVWNHRIRRPLLIWDESEGILELATSHRALVSAAANYEQRRFSPGKLEPVADALWRANAGYLDVLRASGSGPGRTEA